MKIINKFVKFIVHFYQFLFLFVSSKFGFSIPSKRIYTDYEEYLNLQKEKSTDPERVEKWLNEEWLFKLDGFKEIFKRNEEFLKGKQQAVCLGSRTGQEVAALLEIIPNVIGIDLVPFPPYTIEGDIHSINYKDDEFDFVFTNIFDHALYPHIFCNEIQRVCRPGGVIILHLQLRKLGDHFAENVVYTSDSILRLFDSVKVLRSRKIQNIFDSMNWELVLEKC